MQTKFLALGLFIFVLSISYATSVDPARYYTNLAFDTLQLKQYFNQSHYLKNHRTVFRRVVQFDKYIRQDGGYGELITSELFSIRVFPNISLHLLGGGYDFRKMEEWYRTRGYRKSYVWAFLTSYAANWGNEALEVSGGGKIISSHDTIADLLVFDLLGKALFLNDDLYRFVERELSMRTWLGQPIWLFGEGQYTNASVYYAFNIQKLTMGSWSPFIMLGIKTAIGLSFQRGEGLYSLATGFFYQNPLELNDEVYSLSFFWERNRSLLASFSINDTEGYRLRFNLYPISHFGTFMGRTYGGDWALGLTLRLPLGIGISWK